MSKYKISKSSKCLYIEGINPNIPSDCIDIDEQTYNDIITFHNVTITSNNKVVVDKTVYDASHGVEAYLNAIDFHAGRYRNKALSINEFLTFTEIEYLLENRDFLNEQEDVLSIILNVDKSKVFNTIDQLYKSIKQNVLMIRIERHDYKVKIENDFKNAEKYVEEFKTKLSHMFPNL